MSCLGRYFHLIVYSFSPVQLQGRACQGSFLKDLNLPSVNSSSETSIIHRIYTAFVSQIIFAPEFHVRIIIVRLNVLRIIMIFRLFSKIDNYSLGRKTNLDILDVRVLCQWDDLIKFVPAFISHHLTVMITGPATFAHFFVISKTRLAAQAMTSCQSTAPHCIRSLSIQFLNLEKPQLSLPLRKLSDLERMFAVEYSFSKALWFFCSLSIYVTSYKAQCHLLMRYLARSLLYFHFNKDSKKEQHGIPGRSDSSDRRTGCSTSN